MRHWGSEIAVVLLCLWKMLPESELSLRYMWERAREENVAKLIQCYVYTHTRFWHELGQGENNWSQGAISKEERCYTVTEGDSGSKPPDPLPPSLLPQLSREGISNSREHEKQNTSFVQEGDRPERFSCWLHSYSSYKAMMGSGCSLK